MSAQENGALAGHSETRFNAGDLEPELEKDADDVGATRVPLGRVPRQLRFGP